MAFPVFESRLRSILDDLRNLSPLNTTEEWHKDLQRYDTEFWAAAISKGTRHRVKVLLSRENPPSSEDMKTLEAIGDIHDPGVYMGWAYLEDGTSCWGYVGSATAVGRGLWSRTGQHGNQDYREKQMEKYHCTFYEVLKDPLRKVVFYLIMTMAWISSATEDITLTRMICVLAEQVYIIWFGTYTASASMGAQKTFFSLGPWCDGTLKYSYYGTNTSSPIRNDILKASRDNQARTPQDINKRTANLARERKKEWNPDELKDAQDKRHNYHRHVANPIRRFKDKAKRRGMPNKEINAKVKDFQKAERLAMANGELSTNNAGRILKL